MSFNWGRRQQAIGNHGHTSDQIYDEGTGEVSAGGSGVLLTATVTLDNDQIKALPTTPVVIVPATEVLDYVGMPTELPVPFMATMTFDTSAGAYTNVTTDHVPYFIVAFGADWSWSATVRTIELIPDSADVKFAWLPPDTQTGVLSPDFTAAETFGADSLQDNALVVACNNGASGDFTGGNAANTLKVTVYYVVVSL